MAEQEWVMDGVVGFLHSPIWRVPILSYIEQNCIVFNPGEENIDAYKEIHKKYEMLVDSLLESFLEDLGINERAFLDVCQAFKSKNSQATITVLEQVYAAQDFETFKVMMTQKNVELELQALTLLQQRSGQIPSIMKPGEETPVEHSKALVDNEEERILQEIMQKSKEEYDQMVKSKKKASHVNPAMDKSLATGKEVQQLQKQKEKEEEVLQKTLKLAISDSSSGKSKSSNTTSSASSARPLTGQEAAANWLLSAKAEAAESSGRSDSRISNLSNADPSDLEKRAQYLKQQRDMLIARKKSARENSLDEFEKRQTTARPKSSRVARQAIQGDVKPEPEAQVDEKKMAMRKALAQCLKNEVIDKK
ncbi:cilia- and flagella-associated protein 36-like [Diadema antillarum]|uniref:cilia- and flagella-associated protein 36-like n=1 Tax=Diadema antillarum TaxID=105358 RepID=UPI003A88D2E4